MSNIRLKYPPRVRIKSNAFTALRLPDDLLSQIKDIATVQGVSVSSLIKSILTDFVKHYQDKSTEPE